MDKMTNAATLLKTANGDVISIYADEADAIAKRDAFNSNPTLDDGEADPDAPYTVETWVVR